MERPLSGKTVLVRVSLDRGIGHTAVPIIARVADAGARVVVLSGLGNPGGDINPALSLETYAAGLSELTGRPVTFVAESVGAGAEAGLARVGPGEIALMENLRFHADERRRGKMFAMRLSVLGDHFIDVGDPPAVKDGWQAELKRILPEPALPEPNELTTEEV